MVCLTVRLFNLKNLAYVNKCKSTRLCRLGQGLRERLSEDATGRRSAQTQSSTISIGDALQVNCHLLHVCATAIRNL